MPEIALFGGSFNPPHVAHQLVALYVLETQPVDELWFAPTWKHPFAKTLAPYDDRIAMCELAAAPLGPRVRVSRIEEEVGQTPGFVASRTLDTIEALAARRPDASWRLVIGADILGETDKWHRWDEILRLAPPIVVGREGYDNVTVTGVAMPAISSTEIRARIARGEPAEPLVPRAVLSYIGERGLYRG